ncbi:DoxX family protein [Flagellimonas olearia]|uniref:DoxX family protein n=1 Tax=Flagellimonas olearia TaxID=552546 RepID=UPI00147942FF
MLKVWLDKNRDIGIVLLRLFVSIRIILGVLDNVFHWEHMIVFRDFLGKFHFPYPLVGAIISVYAQFIAGLLVLMGFRIRFAAFILIINFIIALFMVHLNDSLESMTPAMALLFCCIVLLFYGSDKYSIDRFMHRKDR